MIAPISHKSG
jgi:short chain dehydrogenase